MNKKPAATITLASMTINAGLGRKKAVITPNPNAVTVIPMHLQLTLIFSSPFSLYYAILRLFVTDRDTKDEKNIRIKNEETVLTIAKKFPVLKSTGNL